MLCMRFDKFFTRPNSDLKRVQKNQTDPDRSGSATLMMRKFLSLDFKKHIFSQVQAALPANTFAVTGHAENKRE